MKVTDPLFIMYVHDMDRALAFYRDTFELEVVHAMAKRDLAAALDYFRRARRQTEGDRADVIGQAIQTTSLFQASKQQRN